MRPLSGGGGVDSDSAGRAPACDRQLENAGAAAAGGGGGGPGSFRGAWGGALETPHAAKVARRRGGHVQGSVVRAASVVPRAIADQRPDHAPTTVATDQPPAALSTPHLRAGVGVESWSSQARAYKNESPARS